MKRPPAKLKGKNTDYPEHRCELCGKRYRILGNYQRHMLLKHVQKGQVPA
jgi:hypothetical protein